MKQVKLNELNESAKNVEKIKGPDTTDIIIPRMSVESTPDVCSSKLMHEKVYLFVSKNTVLTNPNEQSFVNDCAE